jgi:ADP-ribose pyrophosphatase YjhB (NUDIX family)
MGKLEHHTSLGHASLRFHPVDRQKTAMGDNPVQRIWPRVLSRLFHAWFLLRRPMTFGVRGFIFDETSRSVFLIRHTYVPGWQLPGGGVEVGETALDALRREVLEETNIEMTATPVLKSIHLNLHASRRDHVALYFVTDFRQLGPKQPDREIAEADFFPLDALPVETTPATRRRIAELFDGGPPAEEW